MANEVRDPVREFLESYWEARRESDRLSQRVDELTCQCENITSKYGGAPRGGGGSSTMTAWDALIEAKDRVETKLVESLTREAEIEEFIDTIEDPQYKQVLRYRYLCSLGWEDIGELINRNPDYTRRDLHGAALQAARQKWKEREEMKL